MSDIVTGASLPNTLEVSVRASPGEGVEHFIARWADAVIDAYNADPQEFVVAGSNTLQTSWTDSGGVRTHITTRNKDENDDSFIDRHLADTINDMATHPPVP